MVEARRLATLFGILVAAGLGFLAGRATEPSTAGRPAVAAAEMEAAVAEALATPALGDRLVRLAALTDRMDASNAAGAGAALARAVSSADNNDLRLVLATWAGLDPRAAFDSVLAWPLESKRIVGAGIVAYEWSRTGGALETREYIKGIPQLPVRSAGLRGLVQGWAQSSDLDGLTAFVANESRAGHRDQLAEILVNSLLATGGVEAVERWADAVAPDEQNDFKRTAYKKALRQVANRDPVAGARWYAAQKDEPWAVRSLPVIAGEWAEKDPAEALEWLLGQPEGRERQVALQRWITRFATNDPEAAMAWMEQAEATGPLAEMPERLVGALLPDHPAEAATFVARIGDESIRRQAVHEVVRVWRQTDPEAAMRWLGESGWPGETVDAAAPPIAPIAGARTDGAKRGGGELQLQ